MAEVDETMEINEVVEETPPAVCLVALSVLSDGAVRLRKREGLTDESLLQILEIMGVSLAKISYELIQKNRPNLILPNDPSFPSKTPSVTQKLLQ